MTNIDGKVALITGASSGIGAATARKLAVAGVKVGIAARRTHRLEALKAEIAEKGGETLVIEMDVVNPASVEAGARKLVDAYGSIDILFINVNGLLNTTATVLPQMIKQHSGHIFNTSSIAGRKVFKGLSVYCATKHAVTAFSDGLRMEVGKKHNIRVTCIQPGAVATELYEQITDAGYRQQMEALTKQMTFLQGADIADAILFALQAPAHVNVAELFILPIDQEW